MSKSVLIIPDAVETMGSEGSWYHGYRHQLRANGHVAAINSSPNGMGRQSMHAWQATRGTLIREGFTGKDAVLVGHGLGGLALLRFLEEQNEPIGSAIFIGTPIGLRPLHGAMALKAFNDGFKFDWESIKSGAESFRVIHGYDDPEVPFSNGVELARIFAGPAVNMVRGGGHFNTPEDNVTLRDYLPVSDQALIPELSS